MLLPRNWLVMGQAGALTAMDAWTRLHSGGSPGRSPQGRWIWHVGISSSIRLHPCSRRRRRRRPQRYRLYARPRFGIYWLQQNRTPDGDFLTKHHRHDRARFAPLWEDLDGDGVVVVGRRYLAHEGRDPANTILCRPIATNSIARRTWKRWLISTTTVSASA